MFKVLAVMAIAAVVLGVGMHYGRDRVESAIHHTVDTGLPDEVEAHAWAPVSHQKPMKADRVRFADGAVTTVRCHTALGSYSVHIDHGFGFQPATTPVKSGCPGRALRGSLLRATWVGIEDHGKSQRLTFTDGSDHTVAVLQGRGD
jgi:hypothetical protein